MSLLVGWFLIFHYMACPGGGTSSGACYASEWHFLNEQNAELSRRIDDLREFLLSRFGDEYDR